MRKWLLLIGAVLTLVSAGVLIIGAFSVPDLFEGPLLPQSQPSSPPTPPPQPVVGWWDLLAVAALLTFNGFSNRHCRYDNLYLGE